MVNHAVDPSFEGRRRPPVVHGSRSKYTKRRQIGGKEAGANMGEAITM
jgi:hypothetical protein